MADPDGEVRSRYGVAVVDKALDVLEHLADSKGLTVAQLAVATGLTKASVYRLVMTLAQRGYLVRRHDQQAWVAGPSLLALSRRFLAGSSLVSVARPVLERLHEELGETVNLAIVRRDTVQYVDMIESDHDLRMAARLGATDSLHCTSLGKAYLAALAPGEARAVVARIDRPKRTPHTIDTVGELLEELRITRERGYGFDDEENEVGARCVGVAITSGDGRPIAGISVSAPAWRMPDDRLPRVALTLQEAAREVAERSGERPSNQLHTANHPGGLRD
ncbi:MAG: IclR family transcriptional regulator [Candidatus Dormibacteraeota bacterium]|nr:IclR family transcriptional regulator [Candidatus Dormibacteraeota bacterium]